ncbi:hypothetical protein [Massilia eburnea]|uniref:hypothetical protein n=1 Tax=Massilia eburnea TaxID=1776165 RepID=UPI003D6B5EE0
MDDTIFMFQQGKLKKLYRLEKVVSAALKQVPEYAGTKGAPAITAIRPHDW